MVKTENEALQHGVARQHEVHLAEREASSTAGRQVEALKMALNVQQRRSTQLTEGVATFSECMDLQMGSLERILMLSQSELQDAKKREMHVVQNLVQRLHTAEEANTKIREVGMAELMTAREAVAETQSVVCDAHLQEQLHDVQLQLDRAKMELGMHNCVFKEHKTANEIVVGSLKMEIEALQAALHENMNEQEEGLEAIRVEMGNVRKKTMTRTSELQEACEQRVEHLQANHRKQMEELVTAARDKEEALEDARRTIHVLISERRIIDDTLHERDMEVKRLTASVDQVIRERDTLNREKELWAAELRSDREQRDANATEAQRLALKEAMEESNRKLARLSCRHDMYVETLKSEHDTISGMAARENAKVIEAMRG